MSEYLDRYVDEKGNIDNKLTLTSEGQASLTYDLECIVDTYTGIKGLGFSKCSEIRDNLMDLIHDIANNNKESDNNE